MAKNKQVKDGYLGDLPEEIQSKIMNIYKLLISTCKDVWEDKTYDPIRNEDWAKSAIEDFCIQPSDENEVGSVRVYKQGKRNSCMIQITGHVTNHRNDINHELLHDFFRHVHYDMKTKVRRQFDMRLTCESEHGEPFEGFDVWTNSKVAKVIWDMFEDKKTKKIKEYKESNNYEYVTEMMFADIHELPNGLKTYIENINYDISYLMLKYLLENNSDVIIDSFIETSPYKDEIGSVSLYRNDDNVYGNITVIPESYSKQTKRVSAVKDWMVNVIPRYPEYNDSTKKLELTESGSLVLNLDPEYAHKLWNLLENIDPNVIENNLINNYIFNESDIGKKEDHEEYDDDEDDKEDSELEKLDFVPIYGIVKSYSQSNLRNDGSEKSENEIKSIKFSKFVGKITGGDNYSHSLISFDDSFTKMYSFNNKDGFEFDNIMENDSWLGTDSIYICVMFVKKEDRDRMKKFVKDLHKNSDKTKYAASNLLKLFIGKPSKSDKRFICSAFTGYILSCSNPKNLHRDYSRLRPNDITILPRAFYVMNVRDRNDFINKHEDIKNKVKHIYDEHHDEINDYNNHLPKLMLQDRIDELKTLDKIFDWILDRL